MGYYYIAVPHQLPAHEVFKTAGANPDETAGDSYIFGDHDLHGIYEFTLDDCRTYSLDWPRGWSQHQKLRIQVILDNIVKREGKYAK